MLTEYKAIYMPREHRLLNLLADEMLDTLTNGYKTVAGDEVVRVAPPASYMNVVRQFIKDHYKPTSSFPSLRDLLGDAEARSEVNLPFPKKDRPN